MSTVQSAFRRHKSVAVAQHGGTAIIVFATLISCYSSFMIYREGFADLPWLAQVLFSLFAVALIEGAFSWLLYGFTQAFTSALERLLALLGMAGLLGVMAVNVITHYMVVKGKALHPFQQTWLDWGAVSVFIAVLVLAVGVKLANPVIRLLRLELRAVGRELEAILDAKNEALDSDRVQTAITARAQSEAQKLASKIEGSPALPGDAAEKPVAIWRGSQRVDTRGN